MMLILKFYIAPVRLHDAIFFKRIKHFQTLRVDILARKYDVISQLRHSYAKGHFCSIFYYEIFII